MGQLALGNSVALKCLGNIEGWRFLDGRTRNGTVGLAPTVDPPFTGTHWLVVAGPQPGQVELRCLGDAEGRRWLDGNTAINAVGLAPSTDNPFTGTRWAVVDNGPDTILKCLGDLEGPRFLDGRTMTRDVGLAPNTDPPFTGTHWGVMDFGPFPLPSELHFDNDSIGFPGGVAAGGYAHLTLRKDGSFTFSGHYHDSGSLEYNISTVWGIKDSSNMLFTFPHSSHVAGTFEPGSRDDDWTIDSRNDEIARRWSALAAGTTSILRAEANVELINVTNSVIGVAGLVLGVIAIVAA